MGLAIVQALSWAGLRIEPSDHEYPDEIGTVGNYANLSCKLAQSGFLTIFSFSAFHFRFPQFTVAQLEVPPWICVCKCIAPLPTGMPLTTYYCGTL